MGGNQRGRYQMRSFQTAKLAVTTWIYGLARRWAGRGVTANLLDPGIVKGKTGSSISRAPALTGVLMSHVIPFFVARAQGTRAVARLLGALGHRPEALLGDEHPGVRALRRAGAWVRRRRACHR